MERIPLNFCFKGRRDYVHGTDMYTAITEQIIIKSPNFRCERFEMFIHNIARSQCDMLIFINEDINGKPEHVAANFAASCGTLSIAGFIVETGGLVDCRYEYEDERVERLCSIQDSTIAMCGDSEYSPIEVVVAMTKKLHYALFPQDKGRWMFTRLDLVRLISRTDIPSLSIELLRNLNNSLTKSRIVSGKETVGSIYFSLVGA